MHMITTGIVERLDRDNHTAMVQLQGAAVGADVGAPVQRPRLAAKYQGDPPAPLSYVELAQPTPGVWRVSAPHTDRRVLLHGTYRTIRVSP